MRRLLAAISLLALSSLSAAQDAGVDVELRLTAADAIELSYVLPASCRALASLKKGEGGATVRASWQALDGCGVAGADQLGRGAQACPALRFRVPATTLRAGYPAAFPMGQGVYVHLSNYAVSDRCGTVSYRFVAPAIIANGQACQGTAVAQAGDDTSALLLAAPAQVDGQALAYVDPRLSAAAAAQMRTVADGTVDYLRRALPDAQFKRPVLAATWAEESGGPNIGGDAGDVLRLSLFNWPRDPGPAEQARLTLLVAHEFSHRFELRDAVDVYPDARLIHEGGGEFLRWMTSLHAGSMTPEQAADDLDLALTQCILHTGQRNWRSLTPRVIGANHLEYRCGLAAYVYVLAARQGPGSAMARVNDFYRALRRGGKLDLGQAFECGAATPCQARWLAPLLGADGSMEQQWNQLLGDTGLAVLRPPTQAQRDAMVLRARDKLMADDCGGRSSTATAQGVMLDGMKACRTLTRDAYVTSIESLPAFGHPGTGAAMEAACLAYRRVRLGLNDGGSLSVPCDQAYRMHTALYRTDIGKVLAALRRE